MILSLKCFFKGLGVEFDTWPTPIRDPEPA